METPSLHSQTTWGKTQSPVLLADLTEAPLPSSPAIWETLLRSFLVWLVEVPCLSFPAIWEMLLRSFLV